MKLRKRQLNRSVYIDALSLIPARKSGIGFTLEQTLKRLLTERTASNSDYMIYLVVPLGKTKYLKEYAKLKNVSIKTIYLPAKILEVFLRLNIFPPIDLLLGTGIYMFPNYRNWPLWRSRSITYIHDVSFIRFPSMVKPKNQKYLSRYISRWVARSDRIIAISSSAKEEIEKYLGVTYTRLEIVYCGVDSTVFKKRNQAEVRSVKKKYHIDLQHYFLYVGNIEPRKNLVTLLEAYDKLPSAVKQKYGLVLVGGDGWLNQEFHAKLLKLQSQGLKVMKVEQYVEAEDLPAIYSGASLLVHPAVYEGFGITPLEAMACQLPVVVSDIPSVREVVQSSGYYFDPNDSDELAETIIKAINQNNEKKVKSGLLRASELSWGATARELWHVIEKTYDDGVTKRPFVARLKATYNFIDRHIRELLGEKPLHAYTPIAGVSDRELRRMVYNDFLREQPSYIQANILRIYLVLKHIAAYSLKRAYRLVRSR